MTRLPGYLIHRLNQRFAESMKLNSVPLFQSFEGCIASLPVRKVAGVGKPLTLHEQPFWCQQGDLRTMAKQLESKVRYARGWVKYLCAPSASGKTASVLAAFLESKKFKYYLYLAFANNNDRNFRLSGTPSSDEGEAQQQGAEFILECITVLLENRSENFPCTIRVRETPTKMSDTEKQLTRLLEETLGRESNVLVHLDEHYKMCKENPDFRKGAMTALAYMPAAAVIATYTDRPPLPHEKSSGVCRYPIALPSFDVDQAMRSAPELDFSQDLSISQSFSVEQLRLWATLRFRLAFKLKELDLSALHCRPNNEDMEAFLEDFLKAKTLPHSSLDARIRACSKLCEVT